MLTKHRTIMRKADFFLNAVIFEKDDDSNQTRLEMKERIYIDETVWNDMGRPEQITITVAPGDELNTKEN